ncbi:MAG: major capsid protein [Microvirus sp.]|nr:MAG: major capsid protein [Microvirus sp.]
MFRNKSVSVHQFAMTPRNDIPRSSFRIQKNIKTTFDSGYLVPFYCAEVLPGDSASVRATLFGRLATPLFPVMDNMYCDSFFFFVPNRLLWTHWVNMMGEQASPTDSISYNVPQLVSTVGGYNVGSIYDHFGLPTAGQVLAGNTVTHSVLPLRAYNKIYQEWFRDENLQTTVPINMGDGPDAVGDYTMLRRGKRFDYFTGCLPNPQKGSTPVSLPLGTTAPVILNYQTGTSGPINSGRIRLSSTGALLGGVDTLRSDASSNFAAVTTNAAVTYDPNNSLKADLSQATAATINQLRQAITIQQYLERSARGGSRYVETIETMFGVRPPDFRLQRPEYIGGGSTPVTVNPIAQTSATGLTGATTPQGNLAAMGTYLAQGHGFSYSATEHGYIIGLVSIRADLSYQQGLPRHWSRSTLYDFYNPVFANLGEQAVLNKEIYADGSAADQAVFGYQERWAEYRYDPSQITGLFRSTSAGTIDPWHLSQRFLTLPTLNSTFIQDTPPVSRVVAVGAGANGQQFLFDAFIDGTWARPMPMYSVPGLMRL